MNISSLIVDARPEQLAAVRQSLAACDGVEVHAARADGKLVVTLETETDGQTTETFARIGAIDGVMSVAMVYHQFEPDPDEESPHGTDAT